MLNSIQLAALNTELSTDPVGLGYAGLISTGNDTALAAAVNLARAGGTFQQFSGVIASYLIINATVPSEWAALSTANKQLYQTLTGAGFVDTANANLRAAFVAMFPNGTTTFTNLSALAVRPGSRAEVLFGAGLFVDVTDISQARRNVGF